MAQPFVADARGVTLAVRLTPRAAENALGTAITLANGRSALAVRVAAPPVEGAANAALIALLAKATGLRRADVMIHSGETGRLKMIRLAGDGPMIAVRPAAAIDG